MLLRGSHVKAFLILLLLIGIATSQTASLVSSHSQDHASHCCGVCHAGHVSVLQPADHFRFLPLTQLCWHQPLEIVERVLESAVVLALSRAPPA